MIAPTSAAVDAIKIAGSNPFKLNCNLEPVSPVSSATLGAFSFKKLWNLNAFGCLPDACFNK